MPEFAIPGRENFVVTYDSQEDGGGTWFGQEYVSMIQRYNRKFGRCLEWCSGPGFIGFALLAHDICDNLVLMDRYAPSSLSVDTTVGRNACQDRTTFYHLDRVAQLPDHERFDLVVANPPHYLTCPGDDNYQRIAVDPDWQAHREFYSNIARYLNPDAVVLMQENMAGSLHGTDEFRDMIEQSGLQLLTHWTSPRYFDHDGPTQIYYMEVRQK